MKSLVIISILLVTSSSIFAQDSKQDVQYEYMTLVSEFSRFRPNLIFITHADGKYERVNMDATDTKKNNTWQTTELIQLLEKYSKEGWQVKSSNLTTEATSGFFYYLLYKEKSVIISK